MSGARAVASLVLALRFLTIAPMPGRERWGGGELGGAAWWFPPVGLALGLVLVGADRVLLLAFPPLLAATLVVTLWKVLGGGLHLDGLADCLDGLAGRDAAHRLSLMRDSRIGVFGATGLVLALLLSTAAVAALPAPSRGPALLLAPVVGRLAPLLMGLIFRSATPSVGTGDAFIASLPRAAGLVHGTAALILGGLLLGPRGIVIVAAGLVVALAWSAFLARRLGGLTGDGLGAGVELAELGVLLAASADPRMAGG